MKAIEIRAGEQLEKTFGREVIRCLQGKLKLVWGMPPLQGQKFAARKTTSLCEEDCKPSSSRPTMHAQGGEGLHANGLRNVSKFLSTIDYVLVRPVSIARFLLTVCKLGEAIRLAPGSMCITNKHMPALYLYQP